MVSQLFRYFSLSLLHNLQENLIDPKTWVNSVTPDNEGYCAAEGLAMPLPTKVCLANHPVPGQALAVRKTRSAALWHSRFDSESSLWATTDGQKETGITRECDMKMI